MIIWVDIESCSLDERHYELLEVAFVVTDDTLKERGHYSVVIDPGVPVDQLEMALFVREMHEKSGLLRDIADGKGVSKAVAAVEIRDWFARTFGRIEDLRQVPLAGSTVDFDRRWLRHHLPEIEKLFSYRSINVSSLVELASRLAPRVYAHRPRPDEGVPHRALDDARGSIDYLRYFIASGFINDSGTDCRHRREFHAGYFNNNCPFEECDVCAVHAHKRESK